VPARNAQIRRAAKYRYTPRMSPSAIRAYLKEAAAIQSGGEFTEHSFRGALHLVCLGLLAVLGWRRELELAWPFYIGLGVALALAVYQQWLCKTRDRERCFRAFLNNNWLGAAVFAGLVSALPGG